MTHRRAMTAVAALYALGAALAAVLVIHYDATRGQRVPGTPFTLRDGPSKTPERYAPWAMAVRYGLTRFQRYAEQHLGGGIHGRVDVVLNAGPKCDGRPAGAGVEGDADGHRICLYLSAVAPHGGGRAVAWELAVTAAHEAAHVWAFEQGCDGPPSVFPRRMAEGMADDLAWRALDRDAGTAASRVRQLAELRRTARELRPLDDDGAIHALYTIEGDIRAVLIEDDHPERYATYCRTLATGRYDEPTARMRAFGRLL